MGKKLADTYVREPEEKDPPPNSPEWPWGLKRSEMRRRYGDFGDYPNPVIPTNHEESLELKARLDARLHPQDEKLKEKARDARLKLSQSVWESQDSENDPVPIYIAECKKMGRLPDKVMLELLGKMWSTYLKRRGIREPGEEG